MVVSFGLFINVAAQQSYAEDFSIFNGFTQGEIGGQNNWSETTTGGTVITGCMITTDIPVSLDGNWQGVGPSILRVGVDAAKGPSTDGLTFKCLSPSLANAGLPGTATTSFMALIDADDDSETTGSKYSVRFTDNQGNITSDVAFFTDGSIRVLDVVGGSEEYVDTGATWTDHEWFQLTLSYNFTANTISYNKVGEIIYTGSTLSGFNLSHYSFRHDNTPGSTAYFDSVFVFSNPPGLGLDTLQASKFSVFPNPSDDTITITNTANSFVNSVTINDLNGRKVKSMAFNAVAEPQINISGLSAGMYMLSFTLDNGMTGNHKIIKK